MHSKMPASCWSCGCTGKLRSVTVDTLEVCKAYIYELVAAGKLLDPQSRPRAPAPLAAGHRLCAAHTSPLEAAVRKGSNKRRRNTYEKKRLESWLGRTLDDKTRAKFAMSTSDAQDSPANHPAALVRKVVIRQCGCVCGEDRLSIQVDC